MTTTTNWRSLIVAHAHANPLDLKPHPLNFYTHPIAQRTVVNAAIDELGYLDEVVANRRTGHTLNGHLRVELAIGNGETQIPVTWVECDEETERTILLFFDRIGEQAQVQGAKVQELSAQIAPGSGTLQAMLDEWVATFETFPRQRRAPAQPVPTAPPATVAAALPSMPVTPPHVQTSPEVATLPPAHAQPAVAPPIPVAQPDDPVVVAMPEVVEADPVATEAPATIPQAPIAQEQPDPGVVSPAAPATDAIPRDAFAAALSADGAPPLTTAPSPNVERPIVVKVGEYRQEIPATVFSAWWAELCAQVGTDQQALVSEIRTRLQMPDDPT